MNNTFTVYLYCFVLFVYFTIKLEGRPGPDLPIGYIGLSLGPQDPRGLQ